MITSNLPLNTVARNQSEFEDEDENEDEHELKCHLNRGPYDSGSARFLRAFDHPIHRGGIQRACLLFERVGALCMTLAAFQYRTSGQ
jgi:hypothetical protein